MCSYSWSIFDDLSIARVAPGLTPMVEAPLGADTSAMRLTCAWRPLRRRRGPRRLSGDCWRSIRRDQFQLGKIGRVARGVSRKQEQVQNSRVRTDEEVRQHAGLGAALPAILQKDLPGEE